MTLPESFFLTGKWGGDLTKQVVTKDPSGNTLWWRRTFVITDDKEEQHHTEITFWGPTDMKQMSQYGSANQLFETHYLFNLKIVLCQPTSDPFEGSIHGSVRVCLHRPSRNTHTQHKGHWCLASQEVPEDLKPLLPTYSTNSTFLKAISQCHVRLYHLAMEKNAQDRFLRHTFFVKPRANLAQGQEAVLPEELRPATVIRQRDSDEEDALLAGDSNPALQTLQDPPRHASNSAGCTRTPFIPSIAPPSAL